MSFRYLDVFVDKGSSEEGLWKVGFCFVVVVPSPFFDNNSLEISLFPI